MSRPVGREKSGDELPSAVRELKDELQRLVQRRGLSLREVAKLAQLSPDTVSRAVNGAAVPSPGTFERILKVCHEPQLRNKSSWEGLFARAIRESKVAKVQSARESTPSNVDDPGKYLDYFMVGCGVGNRVRILRLLDGERASESGYDEFGYDEFLGNLRRIGRPQREIVSLQELRARLKNISTASERDVVVATLSEYFDFLNALSLRIRHRATGAEWDWFNLGKAIYDVVTCALHDATESQGDESDEFAFSETGAFHAARMAIAYLSDILDAPLLVRSAVAQFADEIADDINLGMLLTRANRLAMTCRSILSIRSGREPTPEA